MSGFCKLFWFLPVIVFILSGCSVLDSLVGVRPDGSVGGGVGGILEPVAGLPGPLGLGGMGLLGLVNAYQYFRSRQLKGQSSLYRSGIEGIVAGIDSALDKGNTENIEKVVLYGSIKDLLKAFADDAEAVERLIAEIKAKRRS